MNGRSDNGGTPSSGSLRENGTWKDVLVVLGVTLLCAIGLKTFFIEAYRIPSTSMEDTLLTGDMILVNKFSYGLRLPSSLPFLPVPINPGFAFTFSPVRRGDIVVFELPRGLDEASTMRRTTIVKRCIGIPGDSVQIRTSRIFVNGREMLEPRTVRTQMFEHTLFGTSLYPPGAGYTEWEYGPIRVPGRGDVLGLDAGSLAMWRHLIEREGHRVDISDGGSILVDGTAVTEYVLTKNYYFVLGDHRENSTDSRMWGFVCEDDVVGEVLLVYWSSAPSTAGTGETNAFRNVRWDRIGRLVR